MNPTHFQAGIRLYGVVCDCGEFLHMGDTPLSPGSYQVFCPSQGPVTIKLYKQVRALVTSVDYDRGTITITIDTEVL